MRRLTRISAVALAAGDTGIFDGNRYFDVFVEYAKNSPDDILIRLEAVNRGPEAAELHLLPTLWFRNTWRDGSAKPSLAAHGDAIHMNRALFDRLRQVEAADQEERVCRRSSGRSQDRPSGGREQEGRRYGSSTGRGRLFASRATKVKTPSVTLTCASPRIGLTQTSTFTAMELRPTRRMRV